MKAFKLLLSLAMLLLCSNMAASAEYKYVPLVQEGAQWEYYCQKTGFSHFPDNVIDEHFPFTINLEGDSILAGKHTKSAGLIFMTSTCTSPLRPTANCMTAEHAS